MHTTHLYPVCSADNCAPQNFTLARAHTNTLSDRQNAGSTGYVVILEYLNTWTKISEYLCGRRGTKTKPISLLCLQNFTLARTHTRTVPGRQAAAAGVAPKPGVLPMPPGVAPPPNPGPGVPVTLQFEKFICKLPVQKYKY